MLEQLVVLLRRHPIVLKVPLSEVVPGNKMIAPGTQAQILRMCDVSAVKHQARPGGILRTRRQWRPTAMAVGVSPRDQEGPQILSGAQHQPKWLWQNQRP